MTCGTCDRSTSVLPRRDGTFGATPVSAPTRPGPWTRKPFDDSGDPGVSDAGREPVRFGSPRALLGEANDRTTYPGDAPAILAPGRAPLTYTGLERQINSTWASLTGYGIARRDRVAIVASNGPAMATTFLGVIAGAACAPLNPACTKNLTAPPELWSGCRHLNPGPQGPEHNGRNDFVWFARVRAGCHSLLLLLGFEAEAPPSLTADSGFDRVEPLGPCARHPGEGVLV